MTENRSFRRRSRRELDALADGTTDDSPLSAFVSDLRELGGSDGVQPDRSLTEFVTAPQSEPTPALGVDEPEEKRPVIAQLSTIAATTIGKVVLTGGVAAAAFGGAVVVSDVQETPSVDVAATVDNSSTSSTPTTESMQSSTSTAGPTTDTTVGSSSTSSSSTIQVAADTGPITVDADGAGTVVYQVSNGQLVLLEATPAAGWSLDEDESTIFEIDLEFTNGVEDVDVDIEIEDGQPRVRIERTSDLDDDLDDDADDRNDDSDDSDADRDDDIDDDVSDDDDIDDSDDDDEDEDDSDDD